MQEKRARLASIIRKKDEKETDLYKFIRKTVKYAAAVAASVLFSASIALAQMRVNSGNDYTVRAQTAQTEERTVRQLMPTEKIDENTPYTFVNGVKMYQLGYRESPDVSKIISPCKPKSDPNAVYTRGVYNCPFTTTNNSANKGIDQYNASSSNSSSIIDGEDDIWSGYSGVIGAPIIQGSWIVQSADQGIPLPTPSPLQRRFEGDYYPDTFAGQWVGISAEGTSLIQAGTSSAYYKTTGTHYNAFYEIYPAGGIAVDKFPVAAGDSIYCTIDVDTTQMQGKILLVNTTQNVGFQITLSYTDKPFLVSWIEERPVVCPPDTTTCGLIPLPTGTSFWGMDYTKLQSGMQANFIKLNSGSDIMALGDIPHIAMVSMFDSQKPNKPIIAIPSLLSSDGTSFSIQTSSGTPRHREILRHFGK